MSWLQLAAIEEEARAEASLLAARPLVDCPLCATRLNVNSAGQLDCPMGDWTEG